MSVKISRTNDPIQIHIIYHNFKCKTWHCFWLFSWTPPFPFKNRATSMIRYKLSNKCSTNQSAMTTDLILSKHCSLLRLDPKTCLNLDCLTTRNDIFNSQKGALFHLIGLVQLKLAKVKDYWRFPLKFRVRHNHPLPLFWNMLKIKGKGVQWSMTTLRESTR